MPRWSPFMALWVAATAQAAPEQVPLYREIKDWVVGRGTISFVSGKFNTKFVEEHYKPEMLDKYDAEHEKMAIALAVLVATEEDRKANNANANKEESKWQLRVRD
mgnify:CR=1 FL=1